MKELILNQYKERKILLDSFESRIVILLEDLIYQNGLIVHQINSRVKDFDSLSKKIDKKLEEYTSIDDITDILGIGIITYLESEVDKAANLIMNEFQQDKENSIDKRLLKADQFGYKSLHIVVELNSDRCKLTEYKPYAGIKCEIQIRSILQHAWAEIEHDLGYKTKSSIPTEYLRSFNRLAALLESADIEFDRLKKELNVYESRVSELIQQTPEDVTINKASIDSIVENHPIFREALQIIEQNTGAEIYQSLDYDAMLERFEFFKLKTVKEIENILNEEGKTYLAFVDEFTKRFKSSRLPNNATFYYFQHFLASKTENPETVLNYFTFIHPIIDTSGDPGTEFVNVYKKIKDHQ